jgi:hypothetical protein
VGDAITHGIAAGDVIRNLDVLTALSNSPEAERVNSGPYAEQFLKVKSALNDFFPQLGLSKELGPAEAMQKMNAFLSSASVHEMTARGTQFDFATFMKNNPGLSQSPQGRVLVADILRQMAFQDQKFGEVAQGLDNPKELYKERDKIYEKHPIRIMLNGRPLDSVEPIPEFQRKAGGEPTETRNYENKPSAALYNEGMLGRTIVNPTTKERMIYTRDGWKPL